MTRTTPPEEAAQPLSRTSAPELEHAEHERAADANDLARQFVTTLRSMQRSDWLELGLVF